MMRRSSGAAPHLQALLLTFAVAWACFAPGGGDDRSPGAVEIPNTPEIAYRLTADLPHDPEAYTQGLFYSGGKLYEGTGLRGRSTLRRIDPASGRIEAIHHLPGHLFGEGIAEVGDRIYQLTWQSRIGFVYDRISLKPLHSFSYPTEGWGLACDGRHLILSDGSATLRFHDPETFTEVRNVEVRDAHGPVANLNELEFIAGHIYANVWKTNRIVKIDPTDGRVVGVIDLSPLVQELKLTGSRAAANGIAYDAERDRLFVTGKLWPKVFEIRLDDAIPRRGSPRGAD
ncbi:MAG: glutaminyl-peptide cyclotransferase [Gammaproteobacteria bacterium]